MAVDPISLGFQAVSVFSSILGGRSKKKQAKQNAIMAMNEGRYNRDLQRANYTAKSDDLLFQKRVAERNKEQLLRQGGRAFKAFEREARAQTATARAKTGYRGGTFSNVMKSQEVEQQEKLGEMREEFSDATLQATTQANLLARSARLTRQFGEQEAQGIMFAARNKAAGLKAAGRQAASESYTSALGQGSSLFGDVKSLGNPTKFFS